MTDHDRPSPARRDDSDEPVPDFTTMSTDEISAWMDVDDNISRMFRDPNFQKSLRRGDGHAVFRNWPADDDDVIVEVRLGRRQLGELDAYSAELVQLAGSGEPDHLSDRSSVIRAAVAMYTLQMEISARHRRRVEAGDAVAAYVSYGPARNSQSTVLRSQETIDERGQEISEPGTGTCQGIEANGS